MGFDADVAVVGAGFAGVSASIVLARDGYNVVLVDRVATFPDLFRAEKLEADQSALMRSLDLLHLRRPLNPVIGVTINISADGKVSSFDPGEQYGICYADTVNELRAAAHGLVDFRIASVEGIAPDSRRPQVTLRDGGVLTARLVILSSGGFTRLIKGLSCSRETEPRLISLSYGFDLHGIAPDFTGLNSLCSPNSERLDYVTIFRIGDRVWGNLFTQQRPGDALVKELKADMDAALRRFFPDAVNRLGHFEVGSRVQVVPTNFHRLRGASELSGLVVIGEEFQSVSPTTGMGLSRVLTDLKVLCRRHIPEWFSRPKIGSQELRAFYRDREKVRVDACAANRWWYYHDTAFDRQPSVRVRIGRRLEQARWMWG